MKNIVRILLLVLIIMAAMFLTSCNQVRSLSFDKDEYFVMPEEELTPQINIRPGNVEYSLSSSNPTIAKVEDNRIVPMKEGIVFITVSAGDLQHSAKVYIINDEEYTGGLPSYYSDYKRINFIVDNSVYTSPMHVQKGIPPGPPSDYTPPGYTLNGWYTDREYTNKFDFNQPLEEDITLFGYLTMNQPKFIYDTENNLIESLFYPSVPYTEINFPERDIYDRPIKGIKADAFKDNQTIERITIPDNYEIIGNQAFYNCSALKEVIIQDNSQLQEIGIASFDKCANLTVFDLPSNLTQIGSFAFHDCAKLDITSLPLGIDTLNEYVFSNTATVSIDLQNITTIKEGAFHNSTKLQTVQNTQNVEECQTKAFYNTKIYANGIASEERAAYIDTILAGARAFAPLVVLRDNITLIADKALKSDNLANMLLEIPNSIPEFIGNDAFHSSISIVVNEQNFNLLESYQLNEYRALVCTEIVLDEEGFKLLKFPRGENTYHYDIRKYYGDAKHLDIYEVLSQYNLRSIRAGAFTNNDESYPELRLKTLNLGNIEKIHENGINNINSLMAIFFTAETPADLVNNMTIARNSLGQGTVKIYVPEEFLDTYKSRTQWQYLSDYIYSMDILSNGLATQIYGDNGYIIQYLGDEQTIVLPKDENINIISQNAFMLNKSVKHITIGDNIEEISYRAFAYTEIETITFESTQPPIMNGLILHNNVSLQTIYVPEGSRADYINALPYSVKIISGLQIIEV